MLSCRLWRSQWKLSHRPSAQCPGHPPKRLTELCHLGAKRQSFEVQFETQASDMQIKSGWQEPASHSTSRLRRWKPAQASRMVLWKVSPNLHIFLLCFSGDWTDWTAVVPQQEFQYHRKSIFPCHPSSPDFKVLCHVSYLFRPLSLKVPLCIHLRKWHHLRTYTYVRNRECDFRYMAAAKGSEGEPHKQTQITKQV